MRLLGWCATAAGISVLLDVSIGEPVSVGFALLSALVVGPFLAWLP